MNIPAISVTFDIPNNTISCDSSKTSATNEKSTTSQVHAEMSISRLVLTSGVIYGVSKYDKMRNGSQGNLMRTGAFVFGGISMWAFLNIGLGTITRQRVEGENIVKSRLTPIHFSPRTGFKFFHREEEVIPVSVTTETLTRSVALPNGKVNTTHATNVIRSTN
jgi:hypothetical protein